MSEIIIKGSKRKMMLSLGGATLFVILGFYLFFDIADQQNRSHPVFVKFVALACIIFFGSAAIIALKRIFSKSSGLIIDDDGIRDQSSAISLGLIRWEDMIGYKTEKVSGNQFLLIYVKNPDEYIERLKSWKRKLLMGNMKIYNTPIAISAHSLQTNFKNLETLISKRISKTEDQ